MKHGALKLRAIRLCAALLLSSAVLLAGEARAAALRVASINMCSDQLLMALADPEQIVGLGPYARDPQLSFMAREAERFPQLSGEAEDVLILQPDVVLAGRYGKRATRELLRAKGIKLAEFDVPRSIDDVKAQIKRLGELVGHPDRASALNARIDEAADRTRQAAARWQGRVLPLSRRGWIAGSDSLISSLLSTAGLVNAAAELGLRQGGFASLETIVAARPDLLLMTDDVPTAEDQGKALLLHPAIQNSYPPSRRLVIAEQLTICGGPMLPQALDRLTAAIERIER